MIDLATARVRTVRTLALDAADGGGLGHVGNVLALARRDLSDLLLFLQVHRES